tara:strand:- start:28 stop:618 length:591 start_codon:yes stop_codon:yes gene_type:complete
MIYEHPWYIQQRRLESITTLELESTLKLKQETTGQKPTKLYPHPKCPEIAAAADGSVWTLWTKGSNQHNPPKLSTTWRLLDTYCGAKFRKKQSIALPAPVARQLITGRAHYRILAGRLNLECFLNRQLESWEVCRHGDLGNCDHSLGNLSVGCQLNNIIDEVESGNIQTTPEQLEQAIHRLNALLKKQKQERNQVN